MIRGENMNEALRMKILEKYRTNVAFAEASGIDTSTLTKIIKGTRKPTDEQKSTIARLLRVKKGVLFAEGKDVPRPRVVFEEKKGNGKGEDCHI